MDALREHHNAAISIMNTYNEHPRNGPYDPVGQACWRYGDAMRYFLQQVDPR